MADPQTINVGLAVPTRGSDVNTWDVPLNGDMSISDGYFGGVLTISASSVPIVLTAPAGYTPTPAGGPTQSQNAVLRFTGVLTGNVQVTLPLPGYMIIENLTTGNFVLTFAAASAGSVIAVDQGEVQHIENDGTNVKFVNMGRVGKIEYWAGVSAMPSWVTSCTVPPYLLCDASVYNFSQFPYLGTKLKGQFGGNGTTTFGVPDGQGRVFLGYDGTGTRITVAVSGINGQTIGAAGGNQSMQSHTHVAAGTTGYENAPHSHVYNAPTFSNVQNGGGASVATGITFTATATESANHQHNFSVPTTSTGSGGSQNVQPSQVAGIWVIKT